MEANSGQGRPTEAGVPTHLSLPKHLLGGGGGLGCPTRARWSEAGSACSRLRPPTGAKGTLFLRVTGICVCFLHQTGALLRHSFIHSLPHLLSLTS